MISIAAQQMADFGTQADLAHARRILPRLRAYAPELLRSAGEPGSEAGVLFGMKKAREHGFEVEGAMFHYLQLMLSLGSGFDTDPQYRWLRDRLAPQPGIPALERLRLLHWHTSFYLDRIFGADGAFGRAMADKVAQLNAGILEQVGSALDEHGPRLLHQLHPQRMDHMAAEDLQQLMNESKVETVRLRLGEPGGTALLLVLKYLLGHGVARDAFCAGVLGETASGGPQVLQRFQQLIAATARPRGEA